MSQTVYKDIFKVVIVIGKPDDAGDIIVVNASGNPKGELPEIGSDLGVVIAELLDLGYNIQSELALSGQENLTQYTLVRNYCIKYSN